MTDLLHCISYYYCLGNHTFAAAKTSEKYESLHNVFAPVLEELNALLKSRQIIVKGKVRVWKWSEGILLYIMY